MFNQLDVFKIRSNVPTFVHFMFYIVSLTSDLFIAGPYGYGLAVQNDNKNFDRKYLTVGSAQSLKQVIPRTTNDWHLHCIFSL